ncbi:MAG: hypothetical protein E6730_03075, partial [Enterococcus casseliflavus]|nr:hypothetical protein [Enterococcus casseliflavus]MDU5814040.1 hypothetical protein [Enterococcus casseliflavus]
VLLFILPKKPQKMNDFSSFLAVFFYGLMSQSLFFKKKQQRYPADYFFLPETAMIAKRTEQRSKDNARRPTSVTGNGNGDHDLGAA